MMRMRNLIRFYGVLDIALLMWIAVSSIRAGKIPVFTDMTQSLEVAESFGSLGSALLAIAPFIVTISLVASGYLLLRNRSAGGYVALFQVPFRVLMIIQPSLFFIALVKGDGAIYWAQIGVILAFEIFKAVSIIVWLKRGITFRSNGAIEGGGGT